MKTSHLFTSISLGALVASLGLIACGGAEIEPSAQSQTAAVGQSAQPGPDAKPAPEAMRPEAADGERRGKRGKGRHGPPSPEKMLERFDTNKNGSLEATELPERMQKHVGEIDTSGDGVVSKDELSAHFKTKFAAHAKERFERKDANKDGMLDQSELGDKWSKLSAADQNGDQKLTAEELRIAFESGKIKRPERRHRDQPAH
jgi:Ca2+-binding EF-hand superfamily protein